MDIDKIIKFVKKINPELSEYEILKRILQNRYGITVMEISAKNIIMGE